MNLTCTATSDHVGGIVETRPVFTLVADCGFKPTVEIPAYVIQSNNCDWGTDVDGNNNLPNDIVYQTGGTHDYDQLETLLAPLKDASKLRFLIQIE